MYAKARAGEIKQFTGIDSPFEEPDKADIVVETDKQTIEESKKTVLDALEEMGYLPNSDFQLGKIKNFTLKYLLFIDLSLNLF